MPTIPISKRTVLPSSGTGIGGVQQVPLDTSLQQAFGVIGRTVEDIARKQEREEDINVLSSKETEYKRRLIPILQRESDFEGSATKGNTDRVFEESQELRQEIFGGVPDRLSNRLNNTFDSIDVGNQATLSRLRSTGIKVEREQKRTDARDVAGSNVVGNPFGLFGELNGLAEMYQNEVDENVTSKEEATELLQKDADDLFEKASVGIAESSGSKAQLAFLESGSFDEFISADLEEKIAKQIPVLKKAIKAQDKVDVDAAETAEKEALKEARDAVEDDFFDRWNDTDDPVTLVEVQQSNLDIKDKIKWEGHISKGAKGELLKTNWNRYNEIRSQLYTEDIANWTPAKINAEVKEGGLAIGGKGSESGAAELIATYKGNTAVSKTKDPKLGVILKQVSSMSKQFIFVPDVGDTATPSQAITNATREANVTQAIIERVDRGEDPSDAFEAEMKPYKEEKSKSLLDGFFKTIGFLAGTPQREFISGAFGESTPEPGEENETKSGNRFTIKETQ